MKISKQARREAKELLRTCQVNGLLDETRVREVVQQIIDAKPRGYFGILSHLLRLLKLDAARRTARVESAGPLSDTLREGIQKNLARLYGPGLDLGFNENADLIGGLRIKVGSDVYDGSIQGRLAALMNSL
ncbi:MAG: F0F1 ATP synthase subunit delta [Limisphaerales bacterium]